MPVVGVVAAAAVATAAVDVVATAAAVAIHAKISKVILSTGVVNY